MGDGQRQLGEVVRVVEPDKVQKAMENRSASRVWAGLLAGWDWERLVVGCRQAVWLRQACLSVWGVGRKNRTSATAA